MRPIPLHPNLPMPTNALGNPEPIAQYYECPHCHKQSPLVKEWVGLTDGEIRGLDWMDQMTLEERVDLVRAIEAKLREKNTCPT